MDTPLTDAQKQKRRAWRQRAYEQQVVSAGGGGIINLSASVVAEDASDGTVVGTMSVAGATGTPTFTLEDDAGGLFALNGADLEVAGALDYEAERSHSITVSVSGVTPAVSNRTFVITVTDIDDVVPTILIVSLNPADNATGVALSSNLVATFSENVVFDTGNIELRLTNDDSLVESFNVATEVGTGNGQVSISGAVLTINPTAALTEAVGYYVLIDNFAIQDGAGNYFTGISNKTEWNFIGLDPDAPVALAFTPSDNATGVSLTPSLIAYFDSIVVLGTGVVTLKKTSDNSTIEAWNVATEEGSDPGEVEVSVGGDELHMHLTSALSSTTEYYIVWDAGVVEDLSGNGVAALSTTTTWSFTTGSGSSDSIRAFGPVFGGNDGDIFGRMFG